MLLASLHRCNFLMSHVLIMLSYLLLLPFFPPTYPPSLGGWNKYVKPVEDASSSSDEEDETQQQDDE